MATHLTAKAAGTPTWLDLSTPDPEAARAFYRALFGWEYDIGGPEYGGYTTARLGEHRIVGLSAPPPGAPADMAFWGLYFASDSAEADMERATALGATVAFPPMYVAPFGTMAGCVDPTGAAFSFWQADQHVGWQLSDEPGTPTWHELYTPDAAQARDFYSALLNATVERMPGDLEYYVLKHGDEMICGIMQIDSAWGPLPPHWSSYFAVADIEAATATATSHGATQMGEIDDSPYGRIAALRDPTGATFKLIELSAR